MERKFKIVTKDGVAYAQGDSAEERVAYPLDVEESSYQLTSYDHEGDFVKLNYEGGLTVLIPEGNIRYIAELD